MCRGSDVKRASIASLWIENALARTLMKRLQGSISPLWLVEPGPDKGASCTCWPGPWTKLGRTLWKLARGGEYLTWAVRFRRACLWKRKYLVHGVRVPGGDKRGSAKGKIANRAAGSPWLVALDRNIVAVDLSAIHRVLRLSRVVLTPKLDHGSLLCEGNTCSDGGQRTIWSETIVELEVGIVGGEEFDETRGGRGGRQRCWGISWRIWRQYDVCGRAEARERLGMKTRKRFLSCKDIRVNKLIGVKIREGWNENDLDPNTGTRWFRRAPGDGPPC